MSSCELWRIRMRLAQAAVKFQCLQTAKEIESGLTRNATTIEMQHGAYRLLTVYPAQRYKAALSSIIGMQPVKHALGYIGEFYDLAREARKRQNTCSKLFHFF